HRLLQTSMHFFFFRATATPGIYTLSLHDALPICHHGHQTMPVIRRRHDNGVDRFVIEQPPKIGVAGNGTANEIGGGIEPGTIGLDRKSTRLNSSHLGISYAVFCLKKKTKEIIISQ